MSAQPPVPQAAEAEKSGPVVASFIVRELETSRAMTASVQARGLAVVSSAGTLVTLLVGLAALATGTQRLALHAAAKFPLCLAAILLVLAASAGVITNAPRRNQGTQLDNLRPLLEEDLWHKPATHAEREVAKTQLQLVQANRRRNGQMAYWLLTAIILEILGVACLVWCVIALVATI